MIPVSGEGGKKEVKNGSEEEQEEQEKEEEHRSENRSRSRFFNIHFSS